MKCPYCVGVYTTSGYVHEVTCPRHPQNMATASISNCNDFLKIQSQINTLFSVVEKLSTELKELKGKVLYTEPDFGSESYTSEPNTSKLQSQITVCKDCGEPIEYTGQYWQHIGKQSRHIAKPYHTFDLSTNEKSKLD